MSLAPDGTLTQARKVNELDPVAPELEALAGPR